MGGGEKLRHPLPESEEARHDRVPETAEREKGVGEDGGEVVHPAPDAMSPDGKKYPFDDPGR